MQDFKKKRVLLADDSKTFVMYAAMLLKRMGFDIIPAENGFEAIKLIKMTEPDIILLDINMPVMDGIAALRHIKTDEFTSKMPVVMISVDSRSETIEKCKELGSAGFLTKPLKINRLHEILQDCIFLPMGIKRRYLRIPLNKKVSLTCNGVLDELYTESLSEGGVYIIKNDPFPVGSQVELTLPLGSKKNISLKGAVIYTKGLFGSEFRIPPGMAIEFRDISNDNSSALRSYLKHQIAEDILKTQEEVVIDIEEDDKLNDFESF